MEQPVEYTSETLYRAYRSMKLIREFEERIRAEYQLGNLPGFIHVYRQQEAIAVGVCMHLSDEDYIASTHRGHGHCIAKGCDIEEMLLELACKQDGICKGKGGSMHIADMKKGMLGANAIVGGNPNLIPEVADSFTVGFVLNQPISALDRSYFSVDYWSVELEKVIAAVGATTIVQRCYNRDNANPTYDINNSWCKLFQRSATNGGVERLLQLSQNQAFNNISGADIVAGIGFDLGDTAGALDFNMTATWTEKNESQTTSVDPVFDYVGTIGTGTGSSVPEWKMNLDTVYSRGPLKLTLSSRYIDSMVNAQTVTGGSPITNTGVPATWYFDLIGRYEVTGNLTIRAGVNNLADQKPRLYSPNVQANTDPSLYDVLGRRYYVGIDYRL